MRKTPWLLAEPYRLSLPGYEDRYGEPCGAFVIPHKPTSVKLRCIVSNGADGRELFGDDWAWDHVSVSLANRCPNWPEMSFVRSVFFADDETVMQLHVPSADHLSLHPYCLHLWRPHLLTIPRPPSDMVAVPGGAQENARYLAELAK